MNILNSPRARTSALLFTSALFLTACSTLAGSKADTAPDTASNSEMTAQVDSKSLDSMSDEEIHTMCMAMHDEMMVKMTEGSMGDMKDEGGEAMSPEMKGKHDRCMQMMHGDTGDEMMPKMQEGEMMMPETAPSENTDDAGDGGS